ncbi:hypothetical protein MBLNU459_g6323t1 [Dothideomycetes sp. NU459]
MSRIFALATVLLAAASQVAAQTWTSCNPLNATCPSDEALGIAHTFNFTNSAAADSTVWNTTAGTINYNLDGAEFTINQKGDSPTIQTNFYIFFGRVSVSMRAASGTGIISSIVLESDDLDEVDWEFMGGNTTHVETNYFGKGNTTSYDRAIYYGVDDPQANFHNYTTVWTADALDWYIDGAKVRTLNYTAALNGKNFPQTPMNIRLGVWAGGDPTANSNGTVEWAGGVTDYSKGPFTMIVQSVEVDDYSKGSSKYTYGNMSGDWQSIDVATGNSTIAAHLLKTNTAAAKFSHLPKWAQYTIAGGLSFAAAVSIALFAFCCVRSRRAGKRERAAADAEFDRNVQELNAYKRRAAEEEVPLAGYSSRNVSEAYRDDRNFGGAHHGAGAGYVFPGEEATGYKGAAGARVDGRYM